MPIDHSGSKRKASGGRLRDHRKSRQFARGSDPMFTRIEAPAFHTSSTLGGNRKRRLRSTNVVNAVDPKTNKTTKATVETVVENEANRNFIRRNILTKGAVIQTSAGKVRITSRPGQDNVLNGVLVE